MYKHLSTNPIIYWGLPSSNPVRFSTLRKENLRNEKERRVKVKKEKKKNGKGKIIERTQTRITAKKNTIEMNEQRIIDLLSHWKQ